MKPLNIPDLLCEDGERETDWVRADNGLLIPEYIAQDREAKRRRTI
jgi:hypothetical protein